MKLFFVLIPFVGFWFHAQIPADDERKPSVYLQVEERTANGVLLRLVNNTKSPISIPGGPIGAEVTRLTELEIAGGQRVKAAASGQKIETCFDTYGNSSSRTVRSRKTNTVVLYVSKPVEVPRVKSCDKSFDNVRHSPGTWVRPGRWVCFEIPSKYLKINTRIGTEFNYEWEAQNGYISDREPSHKVLIDVVDPDSLLADDKTVITGRVRH